VHSTLALLAPGPAPTSIPAGLALSTSRRTNEVLGTAPGDKTIRVLDSKTLNPKAETYFRG